MFKKLISFILAIVFLFSFSTLNISAKTVSKEDWGEYFSTLDNTQISITPGKNETELNFCWHSDLGLSAPKVRISENADMSDYSEFSGYSKFSELIDQRTNNVTVTGIEENTTYYYTYGTNGEFSKPVSYRTHSFDSFKFLFVSDAQPNYKSLSKMSLEEQSYEWNKTLQAAFNNNDDISFIVNGGDITSHKDNTDEWTAFLAPEYLRSYPNATIMGNHDSAKLQYKSYFYNPNTYYGISPTTYGQGYWFRYGDVLFIMVNSFKKNFFDNHMLIKKAVEENPDAKWRIAVSHIDPYGTGSHTFDDDELQAFKEQVVPAFDYYDIDLVLSGHDHIYGRSYFMKDDKVVETEGYNSRKVTDPEGIMYITATGSSGNSKVYTEEYREHTKSWLGMVKDEGRNDCYITIEITAEGELEILVFDKVTGEKVDNFTIVKTDYNFEHEDTLGGVIGHYFKRIMAEYFVIFEMFGDLYKKISEIFSA